MRAGLVVVTAPTLEPITLPQAKAHLRVDGDTDDLYIGDLIQDAREKVEDDGGLALMPQVLDQVMDTFPYFSNPIELLKSPVQSIVSLKYTDAGGNVLTWAPTNYTVNLATNPPRVAPAYAQYWPILALASIGAVQIRLSCGYASAAQVPGRLKRAMYFLLAHWYENRASTDLERVNALDVPQTYDDIMEPFKPPLFA